MSNTKIIVIKMKEIIYTAIFAGAGIVLIILLVLMFKSPDNDQSDTDISTKTSAIYNAGTYTSQLSLGNTALNLEVIVDKDRVKSIKLINLDEAVTTMFPLLLPSLEEIETQIIEGKDIDSINVSENSRYTQTLLIDAIASILDKASITSPN